MYYSLTRVDQHLVARHHTCDPLKIRGMSELFDSFNVSQSRNVGSIDGKPQVSGRQYLDSYTAKGTGPSHGIYSSRVTSDTNGLDVLNGRWYGSITTPQRDDHNMFSERFPGSSGSQEHQKRNSSKVFWEAPASPSWARMSTGNQTHGQDYTMAPLGTQAFRQELLGSKECYIEKKAPTGSEHFRRRSGRRFTRKSLTTSGVSPYTRNDVLDDLLSDLNQHLLDSSVREDTAIDNVISAGKENMVEDALVEHMGRIFSQQENSHKADQFERQNTWQRTTSMPSDMLAVKTSGASPGESRGRYHRQKRVLHKYLDSETLADQTVLGKRHVPSSPGDEPVLTKEQTKSPQKVGAAVELPHERSPNKRHSFHRSEPKNTLPRLRQGLARTVSDGSSISGATPFDDSSTSRRVSRVGLGRGPRVGLSKGAISAPSGTIKMAHNKGTGSLTAPFKQPLQQQRHKNDIEVEHNAVHIIDSSSQPGHPETTANGDTSFDISVDESILCQAVDTFEASQKNKSHAEPPSDDSLEMAMHEDVHEAVLASMDAQGW